MKFKSIGFSLSASLILSGCITPYQTNFDCPVPKGVPCTSMSKINHMIDKGLLGKPEEEDCSCKNKEELGLLPKEDPLFITFFEPEITEILPEKTDIEQKAEEPPSDSLPIAEVVESPITEFDPLTVPIESIQTPIAEDLSIEPQVEQVAFESEPSEALLIDASNTSAIEIAQPINQNLNIEANQEEDSEGI